MRKDSLTNEDLKKLLSILDSDLEEKEKASKLAEICTYSQMEEIVYLTVLVKKQPLDSDFLRVKSAYEYFYSNDLFVKEKNMYKCNIENIYDRLKKLNEIYDTVKSDKTDKEKVAILFRIYKDAETFRKKYSLFVKFGENDKRLDIAREALNNFDFIYEQYLKYENEATLLLELKTQENIIKLLDDENYLNNYQYAEFVITAYINDEYNYLKRKFLTKLSVSEENFKYCENLVRFLNPKLYEEFQQSVSFANIKRCEAIVKTLEDLAEGINTGFLGDGTVFDMLEFYKRVPLKSTGQKFLYKIKDFMKRNMDYSTGVYRTISNYLYENKIKSIYFVDEDIMSKQKRWVYDIEITPDINHIVFRYIEAYDLPKVSRVYDIVLRKYLNNEIDLNELEEKEKVRVSKEEKIAIPFQFVKVKPKL